MKVLLLAPLPPPAGGISGWTERMVSSHLKNNWGISVVDEKVIEGRTVFGYNSRKRLLVEAKRCYKIWKNLSQKLKSEEDIKVVQSCVPAGITSMMREYVSGIIAKMAGRKFILHFRCTIPNMVLTTKSSKLFEKIVQLSDAVFVLNKASSDFTHKMCPSANVFLIPNFVALNAIKEKHAHNERIKEIVYVGGVIPEKGCSNIIEVAQKRLDIHFTLVGKIGIDTNDLPQNVELTGEVNRNRLDEILERADVFLFLSKFSGEGFSNALAEAMSYGLPCIVTDWAANADMIEDKGGIVVGEDVIADTLDALCKMSSVEVRKVMGNWNMEKVITYYSDQVVTGQYVDAYESLLEEEVRQ